MKTLLYLLFLTCLPVVSWSQPFVALNDANNPVNQVVIRGNYRGCAWVDVDNDGDLDLSIEGFAFRNEGNEQFSTIESFGGGVPANVGDVGDFLGGVSWADYDNDGDTDCLYSAVAAIGGGLQGRTIIYNNDGTGVFSEQLVEPDTNITLKTWSAAWGDYDNDGNMDIVGAVAFGFAAGILDTPAFFYKGNSDGTFTRIDTFEFTQHTAPYTVAYWIDYDEDGDSDLFIASGPGGGSGPDFQYKNMLSETGTASLQRITDEPFATDSQDGQNYNFIDYDLDGDLDLYLTNYGGAPNRFYQNNDGTYVSINNNLTFSDRSLGNCWGDFDNDGDQDVLITSDNINNVGYFRNDDGEFIRQDNPFLGIFNPASNNVSGLTIGDYDNDGDLDFFAQGGVQGDSGPRAIYRNDLNNENNWINIKCEGNPSNRSALGTRVHLKATINGRSLWLKREVSAQNTFMGHNSLRLHFGLGNATFIDSLVFHWPTGNVDTYTNVTPNLFYEVIEGETLTNTDNPIVVEKEGLSIFPNPSKGEQVQVKNRFREGAKKVQVQLLSEDGKLLRTMLADGSEWIDISTKTLENGVYWVRLSSKNRIAIGKLVVQK